MIAPLLGNRPDLSLSITGTRPTTIHGECAGAPGMDRAPAFLSSLNLSYRIRSWVWGLTVMVR